MRKEAEKEKKAALEINALRQKKNVEDADWKMICKVIINIDTGVIDLQY